MSSHPGTVEPSRPGHAGRIAGELGVRAEQVAAAIELLDAGNTMPFVARYRKEATGGLDDAQLRDLVERLDSLRVLDARRATILGSIGEQGLLTEALGAAIAAAQTRTELEDLYQPYKPKRRTRASVAREKGLAGLADLIRQQVVTREGPEQLARRFTSKACPSAAEALAGARDIVAEALADHPELRQRCRAKALEWASLSAERIKGAEDPRGTYATYYGFSQRVSRLQHYQVLALDRAEAEKVLRVKVELPERDWREAVWPYFRPDRRSPLAEHMDQAIEDGAKRLLLPAIARDLRRGLSEAAGAHAIGVFARNLESLLLQPPLAGRTVLGIDPGFRTGCKVALVDPTGKLLDTGTIFPHPPQSQADRARELLDRWVTRHAVDLIVIGNGTASRETEALVAEMTRDQGALRYLVVDESGASVYSASALAGQELPGMDVSLRGAVSIARRVQDPLAELVKIDPRSIGVGLYQHDLDQAALGRALDGVVERVVTSVGVDLNTASPALLARVAGIGPKLAGAIVTHRDAVGPFASRAGLMAVAGLGPKAFEQSAGFLRLRDGDEPLDASAIHPESYAAARRLLAAAGTDASSPQATREPALSRLLAEQGREALAAQLGLGLPTLDDVLEQLVRPGRDPRADLPAPILRSDVLSMSDLRPGLRLAGTVRNVVDFGAFVDIGVKQDGLLHVSRMPRGLRLAAGEIVEVEISGIEIERGRIALAWPGSVHPV
ncbi:MAG: RNA-binding transcriptional accessory protein [Caldilineae bacterium]|nr:RNA-binding transcriptional accessory protein [Chloroflexota bacterium]MCB9176246.1 RNA-binding transcriptional accessory protein [Caldilineae bacterium]